VSSYAVERGGTLEMEQGAGQRRRTIKSYGCAAQGSDPLTASVTRLPVGSDRLPIMADDLRASCGNIFGIKLEESTAAVAWRGCLT
jgi:hypothetical protein